MTVWWPFGGQWLWHVPKQCTLLNLVILVILFVSLVVCDSNRGTQSFASRTPRRDQLSHDHIGDQFGDDHSFNGELSQSTLITATRKRHRHKNHRIQQSSPNPKSINEVIRRQSSSLSSPIVKGHRRHSRKQFSYANEARLTNVGGGNSPSEFNYELESSQSSNHISIGNDHFNNHSFPNRQSPFWVRPGMSSILSPTKKRYHHHRKDRNHRHHRQSKRPNIIFILTDDQDIELGSMNYMPKTMKVMAEGGVFVKNAYVTTPVCCPSRSSILTGLYVHNHNVYSNGENCSSPQWQQTHERRTFATYLSDSGYRTAFFGKYLNEYNGSYIPPGWSDWSALVRNSRYYNYTLNVNGDRVRHGSDYKLDYYPDLILNDSLQYMRYSKRSHSSKPYLMVLSFPSPHGPEDAAPQFQDSFLNEHGHRTTSWNHAPNGDKQWLLRKTSKMTPIQERFTNFLNAKRLQTLQSVDEAVHQIYTELKNLDELDNTYVVYTSDHGYHLGQFGLVKGKAMPFEFDVRVPFYVRGPNIPAAQVLPQIVLNIDIAPTLIDIAGLKVPPHMDGVSFLPFLKQLNTSANTHQHKPLAPSKTNNHLEQPKPTQRDSFLIEMGKFKVPHSVDRLLIPIIGKKQWLQLECQKPQYQSPCKVMQKFECFHDDSGTYRIRKCTRQQWHRQQQRHRQHQRREECICGEPNRSSMTTRTIDNEINVKPFLGLHRRRLHRARAKRSDSQALSTFISMFQNEPFTSTVIGSGFDVDAVYQLKRLVDLAKATSATSQSQSELASGRNNRVRSTSAVSDISNITTSELVSILGSEKFVDLSNYTDYGNRTFCTVARTNLSIECSEDIYRNQDEWREKKGVIDSTIRALQQRLLELKGIRRFMNEKRPDRTKNHKRPQTEDDSSVCQCDGDQESVISDQFGQLQQQPQSQPGRANKHPWRHVDRRMMKHLERKKWIRKQERKLKRKEKFENTACEMAVNGPGMNCFNHDNDHWKTPPFWTSGPFCFCQNSVNNSYWCMRTINATHNFLYCEFITDYILYFDHLKDPYQLRNAILDLEVSTVEELSRDLSRLKRCSTSVQCSNAHAKPIIKNAHGNSDTNELNISRSRLQGG